MSESTIRPYVLIAKNAKSNDPISQTPYHSYRYHVAAFSFDSLIEVIRMEINDPATWNIRTSNNRILPCEKFISLYHNGLNEEEILKYKYF